MAKPTGNSGGSPVANNDTVNLFTADTSVMRFVIPASQLLANDTVKNGSGNAVHISSATGVSGATVQILQDGDLQVVPTNPYHPSDVFNYTITDPHGNSSTAQVAVNYTVANSPPIVSNPTADSQITVSGPTVPAGTTFTFSASELLAPFSDPDGDPLKVIGISDSAPEISESLDFNGDGGITVTAPAGLSSSVFGFDYIVSDSAGLTATDEASIAVQFP